MSFQCVCQPAEALIETLPVNAILFQVMPGSCREYSYVYQSGLRHALTEEFYYKITYLLRTCFEKHVSSSV